MAGIVDEGGTMVDFRVWSLSGSTRGSFGEDLIEWQFEILAWRFECSLFVSEE